MGRQQSLMLHVLVAQGIATVAAVDCTDIKSVRTCRSYAAHAFPKILVSRQQQASGSSSSSGGW